MRPERDKDGKLTMVSNVPDGTFGCLREYGWSWRVTPEGAVQVTKLTVVLGVGRTIGQALESAGYTVYRDQS